jgi:glycerol-3-phosphate dehydrogenase
VTWQNVETEEIFQVQAKVVVNATGAFSDSVRRLAEPNAKPIIAPSQGAHLVLDKSFLPGDNGIMVPHTSDGRVLFAIPWHGRTVVGTTDTPLKEPSIEPVALDQEIDFILETASLYLEKKPTRADILSVYAGVRPLVKAGDGKNTAALSRDHSIQIDKTGLLSIAGGKWTTYRNMAQDCVDQAATLGSLPEKECVTKTLNIHGYHTNAAKFGALSFYGTDALAIRQIIEKDASLGKILDAELPYVEAEVVWAAREEMARTVEDILARRTRALFLNSRAASRVAPRVAELLAKQLNQDTKWQAEQLQQFAKVAAGFMVKG